MRRTARLAAAFVIGALSAFGNPAAAGGLTDAQRTEIEGMRSGDMVKLLVHKTPKELVDKGFQGPEGEMTFADFAGQVTLVNFWAVWCPPCIHEMPALDRLSKAMDGAGVRVATINVERGGPLKAQRFMEREMLYALKPYADEAGALPRAVGAVGLPTTLILGPDGREIARFQGDAKWDEEPAPSILRRLAEMTGAKG